MFYDTGARGVYYKTLRICNLRQMARLYSKLVASQLSVSNTSFEKHASLEEHTRLLRKPLITKCFCSKDQEISKKITTVIYEC
jgi:hypothetical protein